MRVLLTSDVDDKPEEQQFFNGEIQRQIKNKQENLKLEIFNAKWRHEISSGVIDNAKRQRQQKDLIRTAKDWLCQETQYINPNKSNLNRIIRWSTSRYAEMRKHQVIESILEIVHNQNEQLLTKHYSSGSVCESGGLGCSGIYTVISVNNVVLLRVHGEPNKTFRFVSNLEVLSHRLNKFLFDSDLNSTLLDYEAELCAIREDEPF